MENIQAILQNASDATNEIKLLSADKKKNLLYKLADTIKENTAQIIFENKKDLDNLPDSDPKKDRLLLNTDRIDALAKSIEEVALLPDPANRILSETITANGLLIQKKTVPMGVVGVIYESRPNVTVDVAALCIQSGNVCLLRGGTDAAYTNLILVKLITDVLEQVGLSKNIVQLLPTDRKFVMELLSSGNYVDLIIPRGSQQLIDFVRENAKVPVIETGAGVCHTYVESAADIEMAVEIVTNAKVSRPSVCNALDTIIVDKAIATSFLTLLSTALIKYNVEIFADEISFQILKEANYPLLLHATTDDFGREFLDFKCSVKTVENIDEALKHIKKYSSKHSEAIVSSDEKLCEKFVDTVDAAAVYANASTRFTDGGVFGLGAEIGISTQKLHARGPFALEKLVTEKWFIKGNGQIR